MSHQRYHAPVPLHGLQALRPRTLVAALLGAGLASVPCAYAAAAAAPAAAVASAPAQQLQTVTVQGVAYGAQAVRLPSTVSVLGRRELTEGQQRVNLSETLNQVPGLVVNNRQDYAQDMQLSIRGFGADSPFGVQGVQMSLDGIPLTMPDGQGQSQTIDLPMIGAMKIIKGPFAALYGNAAGGVIQAYTMDAPRPPAASLSTWLGAWNSQQTTLIGGGSSGKVDGIAGLTDFHTDGWREHSAATRRQFNTVLHWNAGDDDRYTLVFNALNQDAQDPGGLNAAEYAADPRQVDPGALKFDTRKSVRNRQAGVNWQHRFDAADTLQLSAYGGTRSITQYLPFPGTPTSSAGGVVSLADTFGGTNLTWSHSGELAARPYTLATGLDYGRENEFRKGYENLYGAQGAPRNDQFNTVDNIAEFVQANWELTPTVSLSGGVRHDAVNFNSIPGSEGLSAAGTGGGARYSSTDPVIGVLWKVDRHNRLYADYGHGFVTPTFYQLAYRPNNQPGLNFALQPMHLHNSEVGWRGDFGRVHAQAALYYVTTDNEIVGANDNGRTVYSNAGGTRRYGAELSLDARLPQHLEGRVSFNAIHVRFDSGSLSGNTLPGVPSEQLYAALTWRPPLQSAALQGFYTRVSMLARSRAYADNANTAWAAGWASFDWAAGVEQHHGPWKLSEFVRVDNIADRTYVGALVINDSNQRFYEAAPGRNASVGVEINRSF